VIIKAVIRKNAYYDSVTLMAISKKIEEINGVVNAVVSMGTEMNKELLQNTGMMTEEIEKATPSDLIIAFRLLDESIKDKVLNEVEEALKKKTSSSKGESEVAPASIASAVKLLPNANMAVISLPGQYAAKEAMRALRKGLHVMLFSDNVTLEQEVELKKYAHEQGLLMMGPDCGTAIINNKGLCFANEVRSGSIGVVGASGTGTQEVTVLIDRFGGGVSQVIGTGGRDLTAAVGGIMMCDALAALNEDENTKVILLVSKPSVKEVAGKVLAEVEKCKKPVVVCFINSGLETVQGSNIYFEGTLEEASRKAVSLAGDLKNASECKGSSESTGLIDEFQAKRNANQRYVRGLFCGGTLCDEAMYIFRDSVKDDGAKVYCNVAKKPEERMADPYRSVEHSFVDLGDDNFTVGRPHPMIDPSLRNPRIIQEAQDPGVAVILMDVVLGYGSHRDPGGLALEAIREAKVIAEKEGRSLCFVAYVCGTEKDIQDFAAQEAKLAAEGVILAKSNARAARIAAAIIGGEKL
jgi:FdrA protein